MKHIFILTAPTASGKSFLAFRLAQAFQGIILNADSQQLYQGLPLLTAKPTPQEQTTIPHALYSVADPLLPAWSCQRWKEACDAQIPTCTQHVCFVVGGSGFYLRTLTHGVAPIPSIPASIQEYWETSLISQGRHALYKHLEKIDPTLATRLAPNDSCRVLRAVCVYEATGIPLSTWHATPAAPFPIPITVFKLLPSSAYSNASINLRMEYMLEQGVLKEVADFASLLQGRPSPLQGALGFTTLLQVVKGNMDLNTAKVQVNTKTHQYAKRQRTWLRGHWKDAFTYTWDTAAERDGVFSQVEEAVARIVTRT